MAPGANGNHGRKGHSGYAGNGVHREDCAKVVAAMVAAAMAGRQHSNLNSQIWICHSWRHLVVTISAQVAPLSLAFSGFTFRAHWRPPGYAIVLGYKAYSFVQRKFIYRGTRLLCYIGFVRVHLNFPHIAIVIVAILVIVGPWHGGYSTITPLPSGFSSTADEAENIFQINRFFEDFLGQYGLQTASEVRYDLRFKIGDPNCLHIHVHIAYGLGLFGGLRGHYILQTASEVKSDLRF